MDYPTPQSWIDKATPAQLFETGQAVLAKIGQLPEARRDEFQRQIRQDPTVAKLMQHPLETTGTR